jgi:hypothetical protein
MTVQVELNAEIEAQLVADARVQGIPLEKVAERLLQEARLLGLCLKGI